jgi:hypothetical protein
MNLAELKEALAADKDKAEKFEQALAGDECKACGNDAEAFSAAARAAGLEIAPEEVERAMADVQELDEEELKKIGGGEATCATSFFCGDLLIGGEDEKGHDNWCLTAWHCLAATLHTEAENHREACWSDYQCSVFWHHS